MENFCLKWNQWLGKHMFLIVLSALSLGFTMPLPDSPALRTLVVALFAYMTFITSLGTSFKQFLQVLGKPIVPLWVLMLVHFATPLLAWLMGSIFYPHDEYMRLGYLIGAAVPIGVTSVIWTALVKGDIAVSLVAVTLDTLIAPVLLPLFFKVVIGRSIQIDYLKMAFELLWMITLPSIAGMLLYDASNGKLAAFSKSVGGLSSKIAFFFVIFINAALVGPVIEWSVSVLKIIFVTSIMVTASYLMGYLGSFVLKRRPRSLVLTMIYNVGLRNISFGLVLALSFFPPPVAIPITMFMLYQQPIAAIIPYLYKPAGETSPAD